MKNIIIKPRKTHPNVIEREGCKGCIYGPADGRKNACKTCGNFLTPKRAAKDAQRQLPLFRTEGINVFHVLSRKYLEAIWTATGLRKTLVRVVNMSTAKYTVKSNDNVLIYLDVRPAGIFYCTNKI
jgi:hypothetical protein